jgi:hypothetical protein
MTTKDNRTDWKATDAEEWRKFGELQSFVSKCREFWPGAKIVIRASDSACVDLSTSNNEQRLEMKTTDFYNESSKYLRAADLSGKELTQTIARVARGEFTNDVGAKAVKPVVEFDGTPQSLVLNKTNLAALAMMFGDDMERWSGKAVRLYGDRVPFRGKIVETIRVGRPTTASEPPPFDDDIDL